MEYNGLSARVLWYDANIYINAIACCSMNFTERESVIGRGSSIDAHNSDGERDGWMQDAKTDDDGILRMTTDDDDDVGRLDTIRLMVYNVSVCSSPATANATVYYCTVTTL